MPSVFTIEGVKMRRKRRSRKTLGETCKYVPTGKHRDYEILLCRGKSGRWKFKANTRRKAR